MNRVFYHYSKPQENGTYEPIIRWLEKNHLKSHKIHLNHHKTFLFDDCWSMGDDSPFVLDRYEFKYHRDGIKDAMESK
ncbi:MAG TPA: hypothetical protein PKW07_09840 [Syntrophorhabdaceae bacterium]|nr:hypothetical protein [Syntrophorhabdaceae bacterium]